MTENESLNQYRKTRFIEVRKTLKKSSELIAFFIIYGPIYDDNYNYSISKIYDINEQYLKNLNSQVIDKIYDIYLNTKKQNKSEQEIYEKSKEFLCNVPVSIITEEKYRSRRHKWVPIYIQLSNELNLI